MGSDSIDMDPLVYPHSLNQYLLCNQWSLTSSIVHYLKTWLKDYSEVAETWSGYLIADQIRTVLADGVITEDERDDILKTLK